MKMQYASGTYHEPPVELADQLLVLWRVRVEFQAQALRLLLVELMFAIVCPLNRLSPILLDRDLR